MVICSSHNAPGGSWEELYSLSTGTTVDCCGGCGGTWSLLVRAGGGDSGQDILFLERAKFGLTAR